MEFREHSELNSSTMRARTAFLIVVGSLAALWIIQIINNADHYQLSYDFAIEPRITDDLLYIFTAPFLHWSWAHIEGNSIPFLVLGFLAAHRNSLRRFLSVTAVVLLTSGIAIWLTASSGSESVGASGVIFGWFGYVIVRGFFNHNKVDIVIGVLIMIYYLPIFAGLLPAPQLAYQGHIGGLIGGVFCGWAFRNRPVPASTPTASDRSTGVLPPVPMRPSSLSQVDAELAALKKEITNKTRYLGDQL